MCRRNIVKLGLMVMTLVCGVLLTQVDAQTPSNEQVNGGRTSTDPPLNPPKTADSFEGRSEQPWLHVEIETKYAWIYQKSIARAWTTVSRDDTTRVNVGKLCLKLDAYKEQQVCWADTSYIELTDMKRRVATKKKTAVAVAWAEEPMLDSVRVEMKP